MSTSPSVTTLALPDERFKVKNDVESAPQTTVGTPEGPSRAASQHKGEKNGAVSVRPAKSMKHMSEAEKLEYLSSQVEHGEQKYNKLGWVQLVVVLIVEAIALGSLSLPA